MSKKHGALIIFGSGPGIGRNVAALFARKGFTKVILLSRNEVRLDEDTAFVKSFVDNVEVATISIDLSELADVQESLDKIDQILGDQPLEVVVYNAARTGASKILEWPVEKLEADLRISVVSLYKVAQWATSRLTKFAADGDASSSFLVTSGMLYKDPFPAMFSLASGKAAQYNLVQSLWKEYSPKGIHYALIVVGGTVADGSKITNAQNIAEEAWKLHVQKKGNGDLETVMLDPDFLVHVKNREQSQKE